MAKTNIPGQDTQPTAFDEWRAQFKDVTPPDDFKEEDDFLKYMTKLLDDDLAHDKKNRDQGIEDAEFVVGKQWDEATITDREGEKKPTLVFNRLPAFVAQLIGNRRLNETVIKIVAEDDSHKDIAKLREGLIRSIQKNSKADIAYNKAFENQVISGQGHFKIGLEYASDDVFEQDIRIRPIENTFSVVWDQDAEEPTGHDAKHVFEVSSMRRDDFIKEWPDAGIGDTAADTRTLGYDLGDGWITDDDVRVVSMWRMRSHKRLVALVQDLDDEGEVVGQDVEDITDMDPEDFQDRLVTDDEGMPIMREVDRKYAQLYVFTAVNILEGPYELPIDRVPIFRVPGWVINVGDRRERFGLIRFLKDPQRLLNYWRSTIAEKLMRAPKANWIASDEAVEGRQKEWRESHITDDPLLVWNQESGQKPERVAPVQLEGALIQEANMASQDLRDISNLHEASMGQQSNEVSGKAILARQRVGETGTVIYQDNLDLAIEACGGVANQLIPYAYDTARVIKAMGDDGKDLPPQLINDETDPNSVDITVGKYDVGITTGPSSVTKRVEAAESMLNMVNAMPDTLAVAADKIIEAQDWPGATEIARRVKLQLPPGILEQKDMTPEQIAAQKSQVAQQEEEKKKVDIERQAEVRLTLARADEAEARATQAEALAAKALADIDIDQFKAVADVDSGRVQTVLKAAEFFDKVTPEVNREE